MVGCPSTYRQVPSTLGDWSRLVTALLLLMGVMLALDQSPKLDPLLEPLSEASAACTATLLSWLGTEARQEGILVSHPDGFTYAVDVSCTGIVPVLFLGVAIAFFPAPPRHRIQGLLLGIPYVFAVNEVRLISLFFFGVNRPEVFPFVHEVLWECLMVAFVAGFWALWIRESRRGAVSHDVH